MYFKTKFIVKICSFCSTMYFKKPMKDMSCPSNTISLKAKRVFLKATRKMLAVQPQFHLHFEFKTLFKM